MSAWKVLEVALRIGRVQRAVDDTRALGLDGLKGGIAFVRRFHRGALLIADRLQMPDRL